MQKTGMQKTERKTLAAARLRDDGGGMAAVLAYVAATLTGLWGIAHVLPTRQVLAGFAPITADNRRILLQEWLAEAVTMEGVATLVVLITAADTGQTAAVLIYRVAAGLLLVLAVLTGLTGARTSVVWFKVCPVVLAASAALLIVTSLL
jgi:hypothetical protein